MLTTQNDANAILKKYWNGLLPIDLDHIISSLEIELKMIELTDVHGIARLENGKKVIYINLKDSVVRRRFAAAYEIGHHALKHITHQQYELRDDKRIFTNKNPSLISQQARIFAENLLMPKFAVEHAILKESINTVESLAIKFNVSQIAIKSRLEYLGFL